MNSTGVGQGGFDIAHGVLQESILISPQQGTLLGDPGALHLSYHLDGTVTIDVRVTTDSGGQVVSFGRVFYGWGFFAGDVGTPLGNLGVTQTNSWLGNQVSAVVNQDVGDFSHTGTLLGGALFDQFGNLISNPLVIPDSGFDYVNPQAECR